MIICAVLAAVGAVIAALFIRSDVLQAPTRAGSARSPSRALRHRRSSGARGDTRSEQAMTPVGHIGLAPHVGGVELVEDLCSRGG